MTTKELKKIFLKLFTIIITKKIVSLEIKRSKKQTTVLRTCISLTIRLETIFL